MPNYVEKPFGKKLLKWVVRNLFICLPSSIPWNWFVIFDQTDAVWELTVSSVQVNQESMIQFFKMFFSWLFFDAVFHSILSFSLLWTSSFRLYNIMPTNAIDRLSR